MSSDERGCDEEQVKIPTEGWLWLWLKMGKRRAGGSGRGEKNRFLSDGLTKHGQEDEPPLEITTGKHQQFLLFIYLFTRARKPSSDSREESKEAPEQNAPASTSGTPETETL
jgi:hypothetical protein